MSEISGTSYERGPQPLLLDSGSSETKNREKGINLQNTKIFITHQGFFRRTQGEYLTVCHHCITMLFTRRTDVLTTMEFCSSAPKIQFEAVEDKCLTWTPHRHSPRMWKLMPLESPSSFRFLNCSFSLSHSLSLLSI